MRAIFISYRREDSEGQAGRLFDDLVAHFGQDSVFMDVVGIAPGRDFRRAIDEQVSTCGVLLAMIGKNWLEAKDESGRRRLDDPMDFVRLETASALKRDIPVIPVLVRGAAMPREEQLPPDLTELAYRNAVELSHARWDSDVQVLVNALRPHMQVDVGSSRPAAGVATAGSAGTKRNALIIAAIALAVIVIAAVGYLGFTLAGKGPVVEEQGTTSSSPVVVNQVTPTNSGSVSGGTLSSPSPVSNQTAAPTPSSQPSPELSPSADPGLPKFYTLAGTWEDDDGKVFATVADASESGAFEMEQIKPAKEHDTLWKATLKDRDVEIDVFAMPSGSHQMHMTLRLSLDGNRMAGLLHPGGASPDFPPSPIHFRRLK
jgi:TIR domain